MRHRKFVLYFIFAFSVLATLSFFYDVGWDNAQATHDMSPVNLTSSPDYPPDYAQWHKLEEALPQHNQSLPFPEGEEGRYVYFSEHVKSASARILISSYYLVTKGPMLQ